MNNKTKKKKRASLSATAFSLFLNRSCSYLSSPINTKETKLSNQPPPRMPFFTDFLFLSIFFPFPRWKRQPPTLFCSSSFISNMEYMYSNFNGCLGKEEQEPIGFFGVVWTVVPEKWRMGLCLSWHDGGVLSWSAWADWSLQSPAGRPVYGAVIVSDIKQTVQVKWRCDLEGKWQAWLACSCS